jgi:hypothetical protein
MDANVNAVDSVRKILDAVKMVITSGWGSVTIEIRNGNVVSIEKKFTDKIDGCIDYQNTV